MSDDTILLKEVLDDLKHKATSWPPDKFLEHVDMLVENSRRHIESSDDEQVRTSLLALYRCIIRYAFACQLQALSKQDPGFLNSCLSASC